MEYTRTQNNTLKYISMKDSTVLECKFKEWMCHEQNGLFQLRRIIRKKRLKIKTFLENENIIVESNWNIILFAF